MLGFLLAQYIHIGVGVLIALVCTRWSDMGKDIPWTNRVIGIVGTLVLWPLALYNNFDRISRKNDQ